MDYVCFNTSIYLLQILQFKYIGFLLCPSLIHHAILSLLIDFYHNFPSLFSIEQHTRIQISYLVLSLRVLEYFRKMINIRKKYKQRNLTYIKTNTSINQSKILTQRAQRFKDNFISDNSSCERSNPHATKDKENIFDRLLSPKEPKQNENPLNIVRKSSINLSNIKKLSRMKLKVVQNACKNMPPEINSDDYSVQRVKILDLFRVGSFGKVYRGLLTSSTSMEVAVKKIPVDQAHKSREQYFASILKSPYVVQFIGTYHTQQLLPKPQKTQETNLKNILFGNSQLQKKTHQKQISQAQIPTKFLNIVMKKYGNNLSQIIQLERLEPVRIKIYVYQMIRSVAYIHSLNICHRDIKPHNFVIKNNRIFLCDFGAAKRMKGDQESKSATYVFQRQYRAPELLFGFENYGKEVDIWALGCVLAQFLLRKQLFRGSNNLDQLIKVLRILGTPNWTAISFCKERIPKIPDIVGTGLKQILGPQGDSLLVKLISKMLVIQPTERITALEALCDPYFDQIRQETFYRTHLKSTNLPNFFHFTKRQTFGKEEYIHKLIPFWIKQHCKRFSIKIQDYNF